MSEGKNRQNHEFVAGLQVHFAQEQDFAAQLNMRFPEITETKYICHRQFLKPVLIIQTFSLDALYFKMYRSN